MAKWYTMKREFMFYVQIPEGLYTKPCSIELHSNLIRGRTVMELGNHMNVYYKLESLSPMYLMENIPLSQEKGNLKILSHRFSQALLYLAHNVRSSWLDAKKHCESLDSHLFTLNSYEQWFTLMDNVKYIFQPQHQAFWMSSFVFIGKTKWVTIILILYKSLMGIVYKQSALGC